MFPLLVASELIEGSRSVPIAPGPIRLSELNCSRVGSRNSSRPTKQTPLEPICVIFPDAESALWTFHPSPEKRAVVLIGAVQAIRREPCGVVLGEDRRRVCVGWVRGESDAGMRLTS